ncbi:unnamed protein product, partial [Prorocentrum cordatum]
VQQLRRYIEKARNPTDSDSRLAERGLLVPGEALRGGQPAARLGRLRGPAAGAAADRSEAAGAAPGRTEPAQPAGRPLAPAFSRFSAAAPGSLAGLRILCPVDASAGPRVDVLSAGVQQTILQWITHGRVSHVHLAPPCTRWGVANNTGSKDSAGSRAGLGCADFTVKKLRCDRFEYHSCHYGAPFKKPTAFITNAPALKVIEGRSMCAVPHERLEGEVKVPDGAGKLVWKWKTSLAAAYPPGLCLPLDGGSTLSATSSAAIARSSGVSLSTRWAGRLAGHAALEGGGRPPLGLLMQDGIETQPPPSARQRRASTWRAVAKSVAIALGESGHLEQRSVGQATLRVYQREYGELTAWWKAQQLACDNPEARDKASQIRSPDGCPWEAAVELAHWMDKHRSLVMGSRGGRRCWAAMICPKEGRRPTKSGDFDDTIILGETSEARRSLITELLAVLHRATEPGELVFDGLTLADYERISRQGAQELGMACLQLTPHCLRHGGAPTDGLDDLPIAQIHKRGRWKSLASSIR